MKESEVKSAAAAILMGLILTLCFAAAEEDSDVDSKTKDQKVPLGKYPSAVLITDETSSDICGGVLVTLSLVATTCGCVSAYDEKQKRIVALSPKERKKTVFAGVVNFQNPKVAPQSRQAMAFLIHPSCTKLEGFVKYDMDFGGIKLETGFKDQDGQVGIVPFAPQSNAYDAMAKWMRIQDEKQEAYVVHYIKVENCQSNQQYCRLVSTPVNLVDYSSCRLSLCPGGTENFTRGYLTQEDAKKCHDNWFDSMGMVCGFKVTRSNRRDSNCDAIPGSPLFDKKGDFLGMNVNNMLCDTPYYITRADEMKGFFDGLRRLAECKIYFYKRVSPDNSCSGIRPSVLILLLSVSLKTIMIAIKKM